MSRKPILFRIGMTKMYSVTLKIGETLSELLKEQRLTLKALSMKSGVPASTLAEWTNNRKPKDPSQVQKVAQCLGVSLHYLLFGEEDGQAPLHRVLTEIKEDLFSGTFEISIKRIRKE